MERNWFRRVLPGEQVPPIHDPDADPTGPDGGFDLSDDDGFAAAREGWAAEVARARVSLRWIHDHVIAEYARHAGHADLLRERIDGTTGVRPLARSRRRR